MCSVLLLLFPVLSIGFYIVYSICGISDMIDGTIARKSNAASDFGAKFDTVADFIFFVIALSIQEKKHTSIQRDIRNPMAKTSTQKRDNVSVETAKR